MTVSQPLVSCRNVSFGYDGIAIVKALSVVIEKGDFLCIIGENGAGKSTLVKGLLRLIPTMAGSLVFGAGWKDIGYLQQSSAGQNDFPAGVEEIVLSGRLPFCGLRPFYSHKDKEIARLNMERLKITGIRNRCFRELSGGQQRRVLLARALCASQTVLILDEPVSGLDPSISAELYELLAELNRELQLTIIMVSHDVETARQYATQTLYLKDGAFAGGGE